MLTVFVLSRPLFDTAQFAAFLEDNALTWRETEGASPAEQLVEIAGRMCYLSFGQAQSPRSNREYIANLIAQGHESVLEHAIWTVLISGVSRAFTHQLVRHRVGFSFSQLSQQYHEESQAEFVLPEELESFPEIRNHWHEAVRNALQAYQEILRQLKNHEGEFERALTKQEARRLIRSAARSVLPNATETKVIVTANARAIRHFLKVRGSIIGDPEMRRVSARLMEIVSSDAPALFQDYRLETLADGSPIVKHIPMGD